MGVRTEKHCLRSQVGIGSESDCLLGQLCKILEISGSEAGLKVGGVALYENILTITKLWCLGRQLSWQIENSRPVAIAAVLFYFCFYATRPTTFCGHLSSRWTPGNTGPDAITYCGLGPGPRCKSTTTTGRQNQDRSRRSTNHRRSWRDRSWNATRPRSAGSLVYSRAQQWSRATDSRHNNILAK